MNTLFLHHTSFKTDPHPGRKPFPHTTISPPPYRPPQCLLSHFTRTCLGCLGAPFRPTSSTTYRRLDGMAPPFQRPNATLRFVSLSHCRLDHSLPSRIITHRMSSMCLHIPRRSIYQHPHPPTLNMVQFHQLLMPRSILNRRLLLQYLPTLEILSLLVPSDPQKSHNCHSPLDR